MQDIKTPLHEKEPSGSSTPIASSTTLPYGDLPQVSSSNIVNINVLSAALNVTNFMTNNENVFKDVSAIRDKHYVDIQGSIDSLESKLLNASDKDHGFVQVYIIIKALCLYR
jgi:hypothetical protein